MNLPPPLAAKCTKCGFNYTGRDAIVAPCLDNCLCFWCSAPLKSHPGPSLFAGPDRSDTHQTTPRYQAFVQWFLFQGNYGGIGDSVAEVNRIAAPYRSAKKRGTR